MTAVDGQGELASLAAQFDSLLAGAPLGIGIFDRGLRHVRVNAVLAEMNGRAVEDLVGRTPSEVNGDVGRQAEVLYRQVMDSGAPMRDVRLSGEVSARPGELRHWSLTFYPIRSEGRVVDGGPFDLDAHPGGAGAGSEGESLGLCVIVDDVTVETELAAAVEESARRVEQITETMAVGYLAMDAGWRITHLNAHAETMLGRPRQELVGGVIWDLYPETAGTAFEAGYRRAAETGEPFTFDAYYPAPLDAWYEVRATPEGEGVALYFLDITARVRAQAAAEDAARRAQLLAAVSGELVRHPDVEDALAVLPRLLVPALGDWCVVTTVDAPDAASPVISTTDEAHRGAVALRGLRSLRDVASHHADPARAGALSTYALTRMDAYRSMPSSAVSAFVARALLDGEPSVITEGATEAVLSTLPPGEAAEALSALAPHAAVALPIVVRGRALGMISLCWDRPAAGAGALHATPRSELGVDPVRSGTASPAGASRRPDGPMLALLHAVADRVGVAVDNARAAKAQRELAERLQRSLLTEPPEPDHAHICVRYLPATEVAQVGGDWYDAFMQPTGATVLVIGDVLGHDSSAAAAMGQVRTLVRAAAVMSPTTPRQVLASTDAAMRALALATTATAVVARLEQDARAAAAGTTRLRWSNAGHPPPVVVDRDGRVDLLDAPDADLVLGVDAEYDRGEHHVDLRRGSTVLLYTDGLVERRGESLQTGLERLTSVVHEIASAEERDAEGYPLDLESFCDDVLRRMLPHRPGDDVALIAIRLHRQDQPRPAQAGQRHLPPDVPPEPDVRPARDARG